MRNLRESHLSNDLLLIVTKYSSFILYTRSIQSPGPLESFINETSLVFPSDNTQNVFIRGL